MVNGGHVLLDGCRAVSLNILVLSAVLSRIPEKANSMA